jgi:KaiC/GvpD/RAD55 family RecA-like ATPase
LRLHRLSNYFFVHCSNDLGSPCADGILATTDACGARPPAILSVNVDALMASHTASPGSSANLFNQHWSSATRCPASDSGDRVSTGSPGLDQVLVGGLTRHRLCLVGGLPGSGKTTLGLQFLLEGQRRGESSMYVTLSETEDELRATAATHGWSLLARIEREKPDRLVIDNLSELRMLAQTPLRFRWQFFALRRLFTRLGCTVLLLDDKTARPDDLQVQTIVHGVIALERGSLNIYGAERPVLHVVKMGGIAFSSGAHGYAIQTGGLAVYPRVLTFQDRHRPGPVPATVSTVLTAANGTEALPLLAAGEAVDAIVTELSMPGMDGLALIRAARERRSGLPAVLLTGYAGGDMELAVSGAISGTFSLLRKPTRFRDLLDTVQSLLAAGTNHVR